MPIYCPISEALGILPPEHPIKYSYYDEYGDPLPPWNKGIKHTEESKRLMSDKAKGRPSPRKGVTLSDDIKKKISESRKGQHTGVNNPMYGKKHSNETKKSWSNLRKGKKPMNGILVECEVK